MKIDFIADTNFLVYVHEGNEIVSPFMPYNFGISFITEVEILGHSNLTKAEEKKLKALLTDCSLVGWNSKIKEHVISLRRKYSIKLPDSIIAATALVSKLPLISADKGFSRIDELDLILLEL